MVGPRESLETVISLVCELGAVKRLAILANDDVLGLNGWSNTNNADLLVTNVLRGQGEWTSPTKHPARAAFSPQHIKVRYHAQIWGSFPLR